MSPRPLTGLRFGSMKVVGVSRSDNGAIMQCICDCGNNFERRATAIKRGEKLGRDQGCGCSAKLREVSLTKGRTCPKCERHKPASMFSKSKTTTFGLQVYCKECYGLWRLDNKKKLTDAKREYYQKNKPDIEQKKKEYTEKNRGKLNAYWAFAGAKRRAAVRKATPAWSDENKIKWIYRHASLLNCWPGEKIHVDHIVPLTSDVVCGLHCEDNLQLLGLSENSSKGNYYWPDMPEGSHA